MNKKEKKMTTTKTVKEKNQTFLQKKTKIVASEFSEVGWCSTVMSNIAEATNKKKNSNKLTKMLSKNMHLEVKKSKKRPKTKVTFS